MPNSMKIRPEWAVLFHADVRMYRHFVNESKSLSLGQGGDTWWTLRYVHPITCHEDADMLTQWYISFFNFGARWEWVINAMPRLLHPQKNGPSTHFKVLHHTVGSFQHYNLHFPNPISVQAVCCSGNAQSLGSGTWERARVVQCQITVTALSVVTVFWHIWVYSNRNKWQVSSMKSQCMGL